MRKNVFLDTTNNDFTTTVSSPVSLRDWDDRPPEIPETAYVWASTKGDQNNQIFKKMVAGDYVLLYHVDEGIYVGAGVIEATCETDWFINQYWGETNSNRLLVYFMSEFNQKAVSVKEVNETLGYNEIYHPHGLQRVADERNKSELIPEFNI